MSVSGNPAEAELRELVAKTLEEKGVLGKVKVNELSSTETVTWIFKIRRCVLQAQLRASVFLALQDQDSSTVSVIHNYSKNN